MKKGKSSPKKTPKKHTPKHFTIAQRIITFSFLIIFAIISIIVIIFSWVPHCSHETLFFPNIVSLLISLLIGIVFYFLFRKIKVNKKTFRILLIIVFSVVFILQLIICHAILFRTGWDASVVNELADDVVKNGTQTTAGHDAYLTLYPNNSFLVALLAFIKSIPVLGSKYFFLIIINILIVDVSGLIASLAIKKLTSSNKAAILSLFAIAPLILFSPWILIPYSDTFSMLFPILIFYIYISTNSWWKYGLIVFLGIVGYFIKPTSIIILIAIIIIAIFKKQWKIRHIHFNAPSKDFWLKTLGITNGICLAFLLKFIGLNYINYQPNPSTQPVSFIHYLAMGQNNDNCGAFWDQDVIEAANGKEYEMEKFCNRLSSRTFGDQVNFFTKKLLVNYNNGTFAWGAEGHFYYDVPERDNPLANALSSFFYSNGNNYIVLSQIQQIVWLFILFGCIFMFKKDPKKEELVLELTLIGLFMFVMLFEARSRYLFCYSPLFVVCAILGYSNIKTKLLTSSKYLKNKKIN